MAQTIAPGRGADEEKGGVSMIIRTGILGVPELDEESVGAVGRQLTEQGTGCVVQLQSSVGSVRYLVEEMLRRWADEEELDLILTLGGTLPAAGLSAREIVPEATLAVIERVLPGLSEAMRTAARAQMPSAALDRGVAGIRGHSLILNLPAGAAVACRFLSGVADQLSAAVAHIHGASPLPALLPSPAADVDSRREEGPVRPRGLQADEFAAFLRRSGSSRP